MQDALGDTAHRPALYATAPVGRHGDHIAAAEHSGPFGIFPVLCHSDDGLGHIRIDRDRPTDEQCEVRDSRGNQSFAQVLCSRAEVLFGCVENVLTLLGVFLLTLWLHRFDDPYQVQPPCAGAANAAIRDAAGSRAALASTEPSNATK